MIKLNKIFLNKNKFKTKDSQPGYVASVKLENGTYQKIASAWVGKDTKGETSISIQFEEGLFLEGTPTYQPKPKASQGEVDDIPFV